MNSVRYPVFSKGDSDVVRYVSYNSEHQAESCANLNFPFNRTEDQDFVLVFNVIFDIIFDLFFDKYIPKSRCTRDQPC